MMTGCMAVCRAGVTCIHTLATSHIDRSDKLSDVGKADLKAKADAVRDDVLSKLDKIEQEEQAAEEEKLD